MVAAGPPPILYEDAHGHNRTQELDVTAPPPPRPPWQVARYQGREKRFTIHAELPDGQLVAAHTNNTGRMTGCGAPGARCWLEPATAPHRKLRWSLRIMEAPAQPGDGSGARSHGAAMEAGSSTALAGPLIDLHDPAPAPGHVLVGVDTAAPSGLVAAAVAGGLLPALAGCRLIRREVSYPVAIGGRSRADLLLADADGHAVWVEIKNVTWVDSGLALFPDAPTVRGRKHLADLAARVAAGDRAALVFCVQRRDAHRIAAAAAVDPDYARALATAAAAGVELMGLTVAVTPLGLDPVGPLPVAVG